MIRHTTIFRAVRAAFSLLELMIVLSVMVGATALVWPSLSKPLQRSALSEAAQGLRDVLDQTRHQALERGQVHMVELAAGSSQVTYGSFDQLAQSLDANRSHGSTAAQTLSRFDAATQASASRYRFPTNVVIDQVYWSITAPVTDFSSTDGAVGTLLPTTDGAPTTLVMQQNLSTEEFDPSASPKTWWLAIAADGLGRDAHIRLRDQQVNQTITVLYRAMTGAVEIIP
ncbi:MAG: type II secretion system protein [Pirellulaceae bacterium]|nr:type II secretion system protein [Pirellulaceae bacterium]